MYSFFGFWYLFSMSSVWLKKFGVNFGPFRKCFFCNIRDWTAFRFLRLNCTYKSSMFQSLPENIMHFQGNKTQIYVTFITGIFSLYVCLDSFSGRKVHVNTTLTKTQSFSCNGHNQIYSSGRGWTDDRLFLTVHPMLYTQKQ